MKTQEAGSGLDTRKVRTHWETKIIGSGQYI